MSITAKYPARCAHCHGNITPGQKIEWTKGQPVYHQICARAGQLAAGATAARAPRESGCYACRPTATRRAQIWEECDRCGTEPVYR